MALRVFLSGVNNSSISQRDPSQVYSEGNYEYLHSKKPYEVKSGDILKYTIRVYNEGTNNASIDKVHVFIPEGLEFVSDLRSNNTYGWVEKENGECSSEYLKDQIIYSNFSSDGNEKYRDIQICVKATVDATEENQVFNIIAEIEDQETEDYDSEPGTITGRVGADYKQEERDASTSTSFIVGVQDDDDFESVVVKRKNKSEYQIKISKIDGSTKALLKGAKFNLLNEQREVVDTAYTDENGELTFTNIVTYGDQRDIYYVEEQETPEGYIIPVKSKVKIIVNKTSLNTAEGTYSVSMDYELIDYDVDTTKLKYMPITNEEQLKKIGSGEVVEVNGVNYTYAPDGYYQLLNDIELSTDSNWEPIEGFKGVLEGNNHKISNLLYQTEDDYTDVGVIGLFGSFEGMIDSVILDNVQIHVNTINTEKKTTAGHTGIGAFAGEMVKGTIQNCTVNASITASTDNIGGFVGHTVEGNITNFVGDTFNAIGTGAGIVGKNISETEEEREATEEELAEVSALEPNKTIYIVGENGLVSGTQVYTNVNYLTSTAATTYSSTASNIGGFVGCALGSINMDNCTNNAPINTPRYNGAGLVGYIDATDYTNVTNVRGSIENNVISFVLENTRTSGNYELRLGSKDAQTLGLIEGGIYQVLDKNKQPVEGYENVEIVGNSVKVADVDIYNYGVDTYYISEVEPADGYNRMTAKIKIEITKYWDHEAEKFKVKVRVLVLSNEEYEADVAKTEEGELDSYTGKTYEIDTTGEGNEEDTVLFKKKAKIENSTNNGVIKGVQNPFNVAGLVANVQCKIEVDGCVNNGDITSSSAQYVQVSGGIAELSNFRGESSIIKNTVNKGDISTEGGESAKATGIVTHAFTNLEVDRCSNEGSITSSGTYCNVSGIIGSSNGHIKVTNTDNKGDIEVGSVGTNTVVGGILADADLYGFVDWASGDQINSKYYTMLNSNPIKASDYGYDFINCHNYASIYGSKTTGGIAGFVCGTNLTLEDCSTESLTEDKILIKNYGQMAKGGLIGNSSCAANIIKNCSLKKTNMCIDETYSGEYNVGGIIGSTGVFDSRARINSSSWDYAINSISIENCNINNCNISQYGGGTPNIAGVIGFIYDCKTPVTISGCNVKDTTLAGAYTSNGHTAGLMGEMYLSGNERQIIIQDNNVENLTIANGYRGAYYEIDAGLVGCTNSGNINLVAQYNTVKNLNVKSGNAEVGGIFGGAGYSTPKSIVFDHNTVEGLKTEMTGGSGSYKNQGGIVGSLGQYSSSSTNITLVYNKTKDLDLYVYPNSSPNVGGIAGYIAPYSATICSNTVDNIKIYQQGGSSYPAHGGIIGSIYGYSSSGNGFNTYIMDNHVTNFEDYYRGDYYASTGGIIASMYNTKYKIDNCTIEGCKIDTTSAAAGILARLSYSYSNNINEITNCKAYDIDITHTGASNYSYVFVGGAFGAVDAKTISDIDVKNVKIVATGALPNVGGVIGWKYNSSTNSSTDNNYINNVSVKNVDIKTSACSGYAYGLGGMIGNLYNNSVKMNNCHAEDIKVNPGSGYGSVGGLIGDPSYVNLEMTDVSVKNAELYSQRNVNTSNSSYNGVGGVLGCGSLNGLKMTDVEAEDITVYNQALQAGILNASYIGNNVELHNVSVNNSKIIDETINTSRYVYSSGYCAQSVGIFGGPYISGNFKAYDVTVKDVEIEGCAQQIGFVNYISSSNSEFYNIDFEDIKIVNHAFKSARSHSPTSCDQVTVILAQYLGNSTTTISGLKFKDIEVFSEQGHVAGIAGYMYEANLTGCEFENVKLKDTCEFNDYGNCMGLIAAAAGGNITINGGYTKNCEIREKDGCLGNVGALIGSGYAYVVMNSHNVEDVIIENMGDEQLSGMTSNQASTGGVIGTGYSLKVNDSEIHDIDILAGKHSNSNIVSAGLGGILYSERCNDIINSSIHDINIVNNASDMAGGIYGFAAYGININESEIYNIDLVENKDTFTGRAPMLGGLVGVVCNKLDIRNANIHDLGVQNYNADVTGGLFGMVTGTGDPAIIEKSNINNIDVINNGFTKANEYTGGLIGLTNASSFIINDMNIESINVENDSSPAIGGLIGLNGGTIEIDGSKIKNLDIKHTNTQNYTNPSFVGGLVGYQGGNADIKALDREIVIQEAVPATDEDEGSEAIIEHEYVNNEIENISITNNYGGSHGGLIGFANQYVNVENANIDNITSDISVSQVYTGYNDFGGLVGSSEMYTRVVDTEINNNKTESNISSYMGGIVGFIHRQDAKPEVHDVVMNDIIVKQVVPYELMNRSPRAGGITTIINYTDDNNDETDDNTTFENIEINELAVIADVYAADGSKLCIDTQNEIGGLAAITKHITATTGTSEYTGDPIIIVPAVDGILKVRNVTITNTSDTFEDGTKKEIYGSGHTGGLLGYGRVEVENVTLDNVDVRGSLNVGGAVGHSDGANSIANFTIKNSNIVSTDVMDMPIYHVGGVIGFVGEDSIINNASVDNCIINNEGYGNAGGIVGTTLYDNIYEKNVTISNSEVVNCIHEDDNGVKTGITGKSHVGGFVGFGKLTTSGSSTIENCYIAGTRKTDDYNKYGYLNTDVGSIIGNTLGSSYINGIDVTDCVVENNKLREKRLPEEEYNYTDNNNHVGVFAGMNPANNNSNIVNCTGTNVTVTMNEL